MNIPGLGDCSFDELYGCYSSVPLSLPVLDGAKCRILLESYEEDPVREEFQEAINNFLVAPNSVLSNAAPHIFKYYQEIKSYCEPSDKEFPVIGSPHEVWRHIQFGAQAIVSRRPYGDRGIYVSLECNCSWEPEHGLQIIFKNGAAVNKVGPYDGHLTNSDAYADSALENVIYRQA